MEALTTAQDLSTGNLSTWTVPDDDDDYEDLVRKTVDLNRYVKVPERTIGPHRQRLALGFGTPKHRFAFGLGSVWVTVSYLLQ